MALAGTLDFNPLTQNIGDIKLQAPKAPELPQKGFVTDISGFVGIIEQNAKIDVAKKSKRLQLLEPFKAWKIPEDFKDLVVLVKAKGKCTTDHISPAGKWLEFRGHLENICGNMYIGAVNAFNGSEGKGTNILTKRNDIPFPQIAKEYKVKKQGWIAIGDENYGEGSSREHAAMEPRFMGCRAVIAKSFARIAETNLKKQGLLPLWFSDSKDYDKIKEEDRITLDIKQLSLGKNVTMELLHANGEKEKISLRHSFSKEQLSWFNAGSALNKIRLSYILCISIFLIERTHIPKEVHKNIEPRKSSKIAIFSNTPFVSVRVSKNRKVLALNKNASSNEVIPPK